MLTLTLLTALFFSLSYGVATMIFYYVTRDIAAFILGAVGAIGIVASTIIGTSPDADHFRIVGAAFAAAQVMRVFWLMGRRST